MDDHTQCSTLYINIKNDWIVFIIRDFGHTIALFRREVGSVYDVDLYFKKK
jgi:hypothetical protein